MTKRDGVFLGLIHTGPCQGIVAPAFVESLTEAELRDVVRHTGSLCMKCGEDVPDDDLEAEYA